MPNPTFEDLKDEYTRLWAAMRLRPERRVDVEAAARKVLAGKERYHDVSTETNVPWYIVGVIHKMEANCDFGCHLHNGDPLTRRTRLVPAGRPLEGNPPFPWEVSAEDALEMKKLQEITEWSVERICFELERYNGFGYRKYHPQTLSPYLWSYTTNYARGKYVEDGKWSASAVSGQSGAMAILLALSKLDDSVQLLTAAELATERERHAAPPEPTVVQAFPKADLDDDTPPTRPPMPAPEPTTSFPPTTADAAPGGWIAERNFAQLNNLVEQGSRTASILKKGKDAVWGVFGGIGLFGAVGSRTATFLIVAALLGGVAVVVYFVLKRAEKFFVAAKKDGRYDPRKA